MKKYFVLLLFSMFCFSQNEIEDSTLDSLFKRSINSRIDLSISSGYKYFEINRYTERIKYVINNPIFKFPSNKELFKTSIKSKNPITLYRMFPKIISKDTVDINFGDVSYKAKRGLYLKPRLHFRKIFLSISCGGTNGYSPDVRFIYDKKLMKWEMVENKYNTSYQNF